MICDFGLSNHGDREANANLIAAAPDLLKACQAAEDALCRATFPGPRKQSDLNYAIDKCREALAKAMAPAVVHDAGNTRTGERPKEAVGGTN